MRTMDRFSMSGMTQTANLIPEIRFQMMNRRDDNFLQVRIMNFEFRNIVFHQMLGIPMTLGDETNKKKSGSKGRYKGTCPASLDSFRMFKACEEKGSFGVPYNIDSSHRIKCSDALINVHFASGNMNNLLICGNIAASLEFPKRSRLGITKGHYDKIKEKYYKFRDLFKKNQELYDIEEKTEKQQKEFDEVKRNLKAEFNVLLNHYVNYKTSEMEEIDSKEPPAAKIRYLVYREGINVEFDDGSRHYRVYKRSASKAKNGDCLFIWDEIYEEMMDWTWLGLPIRKIENLDLTSAKAYEALVSSSIENTVKIDPKKILLIDSVQTKDAPGNRRILTYYKDKDGCERYDLFTPEEYKKKKKKEFKSPNVIWDGQALVDSSVFKRAGYTGRNSHGMMLLRNSFFKACAFNTNIQDFYKEKDVKTVTDMFGNKKKASDIEVIVTPDSLKLFKFASVFHEAVKKSDPSVKENDEKKWLYEYWTKNVPDTFGIVKNEKASYLGRGKYHEASYQVLNTLPLDKNDVKNILEKDLEYIELLKNNDALMMYRLRNTTQSARKRFFIYFMFKYFKEFENTLYYCKFKNKEIFDYKEKLKRGRVKLAGDFYVLCSMPYEMLKYSAFPDEEIEPCLDPDEAYIRGYENGKKILLFRYPHISSGSVCLLKSKKCGEYDRYFNFDNRDGSNIVVISPWESNIMVQLGGADFDSDTALFIRDENIQKAAERLFTIKALTGGSKELPVAQADPDIKINKIFDYTYDEKDMAEIDHHLSETSKSIGSISNNAQLFNSYLWEGYFKKDKSEEYLRTVYECILKLAVLNELEIDKSKHEIAFDTEEARKIINSTKHGKDGERIVVLKEVKKKDKDGDDYTKWEKELPAFLYNGSTGVLRETENDKLAEFWDCPVDNIGRILAESSVKTGRDQKEKKSDIESLLPEIIGGKPGKESTKHVAKRKELVRIMLQACSSLSELDKFRDTDDDDSREEERNEIQTECVERCLAVGKVPTDTLIRLFQMSFEKYSEPSKKDAKHRHKKGDYKHPEIADEKIRYRFLGLLMAYCFALEQKNEGMVMDKVFDIGGFRRDTLYELKPGEKCKDSINIWGVEYGRKPDDSPDIEPD